MRKSDVAKASAMKRLPPLNALKTFESAARHLSFTKAAEELHVTPGAVSQQIKSLEDFIGAPVFRRRRRALLLTDEAQASLPVLREGFDRLAEAARILSVRGDSRRLAVSVAPSFASKWLVPRINRFQEQKPDIEVWISADMDIVDFAADDVDLAVRYGAGHYPGLEVERLLDETIVPVCSPRLLAGQKPLREPADLCKHALLHDGSPFDQQSLASWDMWLKAAGVEGVDATRGPKFNQSSLVIEAAIAGRGVALAKTALAQADIDAGRLVAPFDMPAAKAFSYFIVHPKGRGSSAAIKAFKTWLHAEAGNKGTPPKK
jgi:LysR family glycine cleavage system transcriptional activator